MNIQRRSCSENRLCMFNECMRCTRGFFFMFAFVPFRHFTLFQKHTRPQPCNPPSSFVLIVGLWVHFVQPIVFWLSFDDVLKIPFVAEATSISWALLTRVSKFFMMWGLVKYPFVFCSPLHMLATKILTFFSFVTYQHNMLTHFLVVGKAWPKAEQSHFSSRTISYFFIKWFIYLKV